MRIYFAATFGLILLSTASAQTQNAGAISGIVTNRATGEPIRQAEVTVLDSHDAFGISITDSEGRFRVSSLPPGEYRVHVNRPGFERTAYGSRGPDRPGRIISLAENQVESGITVSLQPLGVITGVVLDEDGDPIPQAQVQLFRAVYRRGKQRLNHQNTAQTNQRGEYRLYHLAPGRYYLMAHSDGRPIIRYAGSTGESNSPIAFLAGEQFYPNADDPSAAEAVTPIPGKELRGIDFRLRAHQQAHLRARLELPNDLPAKGKWEIMLASSDLPNWSNRGYGGELPADTFDEQNLSPGKYVLVAELTAGAKRYRGVQTLDVAAGSDQQVTIPLQPAAQISGLIQVEGPAAGKYRRFQVTLVPGDGIPDFRPQRAGTKEDLHFDLPNVPPGVWDIGVDPIPAGGFLKSMLLGDQDVLTGDMVIGPKSPTMLKITIGTQGAKLEGDLDGDPLQDGARATILLSPEGRFSRVLSFFQTKVTDAKGHFSIDGLRPGRYNVYAFEDLAPDAYQDPEFLKPFAKWALPVELREGQAATARPRLIPASLAGERRE